MATSIATSRGHGDKKPRLAERLITVLLSEPTIEGAARAAGVSIRTVHRWTQDLDFNEAFVFAKNNTMEAATAQLQGASSKAVDALLEVARMGEPDAGRVSAARAILEFGFRGLENEVLAKRLDELEKLRRSTL
jgi:hypothetical protein